MKKVMGTFQTAESGTDAFSKKEGVEGLVIQFEGEQPEFLSWASFKKLIAYKKGKVAPQETPLFDAVK